MQVEVQTCCNHGLITANIFSIMWLLRCYSISVFIYNVNIADNIFLNILMQLLLVGDHIIEKLKLNAHIIFEMWGDAIFDLQL